MESIPVPTKIERVESSKDRARFVIEPCYPGYGTTIGNALRRVLLSSLPGAAITAVKIEGADHEFSTLPYVKEDAVGIILNLKLVRFTLHDDEPVTLKLSKKGEGVVTAADFVGPSNVEVVSGKQVIATLTDKAAVLEMEIVVQRGRGYVPVENREKEKLDLGWIAVDAIYTPMKTVNFSIENVRVGQITNYDRLVLDIETDGTIQPDIALVESAKILVDHFSAVNGLPVETGHAETPKKKRTSKKKADPTDAPTAESGAEHAASE
ncbi:MAG: DNA-directed RNA polymerase subunit alpha [Candidatus Kerfeldbacteria bacterium]|nr:DNA-directed RNA polymerase subunit alpha [Candidatus Kerfeldbacteria bacterium]